MGGRDEYNMDETCILCWVHTSKVGFYIVNLFLLSLLKVRRTPHMVFFKAYVGKTELPTSNVTSATDTHVCLLKKKKFFWRNVIDL